MFILCWLTSALLILIVARVILSFIPVEDNGVIGAIGTLVVNVTEPILATVRRALPMPGDIPLDFSPAIVMFGLFFIRQFVC